MYQPNGSFIVEVNDGSGWEIIDGPVTRALARELRNEYRDASDYIRVRILPVGTGLTVTRGEDNQS